MKTQTTNNSFANHIENAPSYTLARAKEYYQENNLGVFGIPVTSFAQLVTKGQLPNFDKVPKELLEDVMVACYKQAFNRNESENIRTIIRLPENLRNRVISSNIARRILLQHSRGGGFIGLAYLPSIPKGAITDDIMTEVTRQVVNHLNSRASKSDCGLACLPEDYFTAEIAMLAVKANGLNLEFVPDYYKTKEVCKEALQGDGGALKFVPDDQKADFYVDAAKSGKGLSTIPVEDRTDRLCTIAVEANGMEIQHVPADKLSYALALMAVDSDAESIKFIPDEVVDKEVVTRFLISVYAEKHECRDYNINGEYSESRETKVYPLQKALDILTKGYSSRSSQREAIEEVILEAIKRKPEIFKNVVAFNGKRQWGQLEGILNMSICMQAFKSLESNLMHIPSEFTVRVWKDFTKGM